jgi:hypothetical protein
MDLKETEYVAWNGNDWSIAHNRVQWQTLVSTVMNMLAPRSIENLLDS